MEILLYSKENKYIYVSRSEIKKKKYLKVMLANDKIIRYLGY